MRFPKSSNNVNVLTCQN